MTRIETVVTHTLAWMTTGAAVAVPAFFLPQPDDPLLTFVIHLALLCVFGLGLAFHLAPLIEEPWFDGLEMGEQGRRALTWVAAIAAITGAVGGVAVATAAAMRYEPSLQFLLLLVAATIAWIVASAVFGTRRRFGGTMALSVGGAMVVIALGSMWRYFDEIGFSPGGGWMLDGAALLRLVILALLGLATVAVILLSVGIRFDGGRSGS